MGDILLISIPVFCKYFQIIDSYVWATSWISSWYCSKVCIYIIIISISYSSDQMAEASTMIIILTLFLSVIYQYLILFIHNDEVDSKIIYLWWYNVYCKCFSIHFTSVYFLFWIITNLFHSLQKWGLNETKSSFVTLHCFPSSVYEI